VTPDKYAGSPPRRTHKPRMPAPQGRFGSCLAPNFVATRIGQLLCFQLIQFFGGVAGSAIGVGRIACPLGWGLRVLRHHYIIRYQDSQIWGL
jgi:hypothetical protein